MNKHLKILALARRIYPQVSKKTLVIVSKQFAPDLPSQMFVARAAELPIPEVWRGELRETWFCQETHGDDEPKWFMYFGYDERADAVAYHDYIGAAPHNADKWAEQYRYMQEWPTDITEHLVEQRWVQLERVPT